MFTRSDGPLQDTAELARIDITGVTACGNTDGRTISLGLAAFSSPGTVALSTSTSYIPLATRFGDPTNAKQFPPTIRASNSVAAAFASSSVGGNNCRD